MKIFYNKENLSDQLVSCPREATRPSVLPSTHCPGDWTGLDRRPPLTILYTCRTTITCLLLQLLSLLVHPGDALQPGLVVRGPHVDTGQVGGGTLDAVRHGSGQLPPAVRSLHDQGATAVALWKRRKSSVSVVRPFASPCPLTSQESLCPLA